MLWWIILILVLLWAAGLVALPGLGGLVHILIVIAVIVLIYQLVTGRRVD